MSDNTIELIRSVNPLPSGVPAPPLERMLVRLENDPVRPLAGPPRSAQRPERETRWRRLGPAWRIAGAIATVAVVVAVAVVIVAGAGHRSPKTENTVPPVKPQTWEQRLQASRRALIAELAPLRRSQTAAERAVARAVNRHEMPFEEYYGTPDRSLVRYATTTPWGQRLYFVPITPWTAQGARAHVGKGVHAPPPVEEVGVYSPHGSIADGGGSAARIHAGTVGIFWGPDAATRGLMRGWELVPDGVAKLDYVFPRQPGGAQYGYPTYPRVGHLTVAVHGNIAAVQARRYPAEAQAWYAADGHVLKRFPAAAGAAKVVPVKQPGPETAQSRAAERDPSTPNRVWVTSAVGGPTTVFKLHFRALLNEADYGFRFSGTSCRGDHGFPAGMGRNPSGAQLLRGQLVTDALNGVGHCKGTYRIAVNVTGLEPLGEIRPVGRKIAARPFGSATFTVR
jgi:hypothetical protein